MMSISYLTKTKTSFVLLVLSLTLSQVSLEEKAQIARLFIRRPC